MFRDRLLQVWGVNAVNSFFGTNAIITLIVNGRVTSSFEELNGFLGSKAWWLNLACHQPRAFVPVFILVFPRCFPIGNKLDFQILELKWRVGGFRTVNEKARRLLGGGKIRGNYC